MPNYPIPPERLSELASNACTTTFDPVTVYEHSQTSDWNTSIINTLLHALLSATSTPSSPSPYKFAVTSTIIQHTTSPSERGMHSASGAYWDSAKDGTWSYKYEGGEGKGFDAVVSVIWIGL